MRVVIVAALSLVLAAPALAAADKLPPDRAPLKMTPTEIEAYNAGLDKSHPNYITCRKIEAIGSLARKLRVCLTNDQWKEASARSNDNARETLESFARSGGTNGN